MDFEAGLETYFIAKGCLIRPNVVDWCSKVFIVFAASTDICKYDRNMIENKALFQFRPPANFSVKNRQILKIGKTGTRGFWLVLSVFGQVWFFLFGFWLSFVPPPPENFLWLHQSLRNQHGKKSAITAKWGNGLKNLRGGAKILLRGVQGQGA